MSDLQLVILQDRCKVVTIKDKNPDVFEKLTTFKLCKIADNTSIQFCGLAWVEHNSAYMFIPRQSLCDTPEENFRTACLTMRTLARFGREMINRIGVSSGAEGQTGLLAVISELANDFVQHGIYSDRARYHARNSGKPLWARTVAVEQVYVGNEGEVVYPNIRTTRTKDSRDSLLARIQAAVMLEITSHHSWWLNGLRDRDVYLKEYDPPLLQRFLWATHLRLLLPELYSIRAINLTKVLISYLENDRDRHSGEFYYGIEDFHVVWEYMLRKTLKGVELGWNKKLPKVAYIRSDKNIDTQERGLQMDIVLKDSCGYRIVDAKYYDAQSISNTPTAPDIIKQLFYQLFFESIVDNDSITNCFVFPSKKNNGTYSCVEIHQRDGTVVDKFKKIYCHYLSVMDVMNAFVQGKKLTLPPN